MWGVIAPLRELPPRVVSGYLWGIRDVDPMPAEFEELVRGSKLHGIPAATLGRLLRPELFDEMIGTLEARMKEVYEETSEVESQRPWRFVLDYNWRIHAGGVPWKMSFGSWPVLPILDREVLEAVFTLPHETLANRRAQHETIRRRAPDLARLPLDRNTHNTLPIDPLPWHWMRHGIRMALGPIRGRIPGGTERRYYHRIYDINNPGWHAVRRIAEPHRDRLADLFDMDVLRELLPAPDRKIEVEHKIRDSYGTKQLIGLMLWSADHLS
jgi:asparagine synthase (glutamine-hydrolysing)